jgi:hypothetical protein
MHKVFISYYHNDDQAYKNWFVQNFGNLFINKSVELGDINTDVSTDYIKQLIQSDDFLADASVLIVICGPNTWGRKHVDWEISGALDSKVGGSSGVLGLLLPTYSGYAANTYNSATLPKRLVANVESGFAKLYRWTEDAGTILNYVEAAFQGRTKTDLIVNRSIPQMTYNMSGI